MGLHQHAPSLNGRQIETRTAAFVAALCLLSGWGFSQPAGPPDFYADNAELRHFVQEGLDQNPAVREALARYRAGLQRVKQVRSLPDPMLSFNQFIRNVETRVGPQLNSFSVSQKLPWFGKLDLQGRIALQDASALLYDYQTLQWAVIEEVKRTYYELGYVDRAEELVRQERIVLARYEQLSQSQYSQGRGPLRAIVRIQAEITKVDNRLLLLGQQRRSLQAQFNTLLDRDNDQAVAPPGELSIPRVNLDVARLYALGRENRPELRGALERIEGRQQSVELSKKQGWPDLTLSAGLVNVGDRRDTAGILMPPPDNGKNAFSFSVGLNIPLWRDKYDAAVLQATENVIAGREAYRRLDNRMQFEIRDQAVRLESLGEQLSLYDSLLIPQAEQTLRSTESDFEIGRAGSFELLDSERFVLQLQLQKARQQVDFLKSLAAMERAVGTRFPQ